jgi:hypothetical protein
MTWRKHGETLDFGEFTRRWTIVSAPWRQASVVLVNKWFTQGHRRSALQCPEQLREGDFQVPEPRPSASRPVAWTQS